MTICSYCGKEFKGNRKYCSSECRKSALEVNYEHVCSYCGKVFYNKKKSSKYCSHKCVGESQRNSNDDVQIRRKIMNTFSNIRGRCYSRNFSGYKTCGGIGIRVFQGWLDDKEEFYRWSLNNGYSLGKKLERLNKSKDFTPDNCIWCNSTSRHYHQDTVCYKGELITIRKLAEILDIPLRVLKERKVNGWSDKRIIDTPYKIEDDTDGKIHICKLCGKKFVSDKDYVSYCSYRCVYESRKRREVRRCVCCGNEFEVVTSSNQKCCSEKCAQQLNTSVIDIFGNKDRLHCIWSSMKTRCYNKRSSSFHNYGGRGIIICDEWKNSFKSFYIWANSNGYKDGLTIDRINTNGNYEPSNCRWVTYEQQANNKRNNRFVEYSGVLKTIGQWANEKDLSWDIIDWRLSKGWSVEDALNTPRMNSNINIENN